MKLRFAEIQNAVLAVECAEARARTAQDFEQAAGLNTALCILRRVAFSIDEPSQNSPAKREG